MARLGVAFRGVWSGARRVAILAVLCGAVLPCVSAAETEWQKRHAPRFESVDAARRQLDGPIRAITEDGQGLVWAVAGAELWRWDGYRLVRARLQAERSEVDASPVLQTVAADPSGELWVGATQGLYRVDREHPARPALVPVPIAGPPPSIRIIAFAPAGVGGEVQAWMGDADGLLRLARDGRVTRHPIPEAGTNRLHALHVDRRGRVWVGTTLGLYEARDTADGLAFSPLPLPVDDPRIAALTEDAEGQLWVGTANQGLHRFSPEGQHTAVPWPAGLEATPRIFSMAFAGPRELWVGSFGQGLWVLDLDDFSWRQHRHDRGRRGSLEDDSLWALYRDSRGLGWVGSNAGLQFHDIDQRRLLNLPLSDVAGEATTRLRAHGMARSGDGFWLGTSGGRLRFFGPGSPAATDAALGRLWGQGDVTRGAVELVARMDASRWLVGSDWRTALIEPAAQRATDFQPEARGPARYTSAAVAWRGAWWLSAPEGLWRIPLDRDGAPRDAEAVNVLDGEPGERRVASLLATGDTLWVGTWAGLAALDRDGGFRRVDVPGLDAHFIATLVVDALGRLWVGTSAGGLYHAPLGEADRPEAWGRIGEAEGLPGNGVAALAVDSAGQVWVSGSRGLASIDAETLRVRGYRADQGAAAAPYARRSVVALDDGAIAFGGSDAITLVLPGAGAGAPPSPPDVVLTDLVLNEDEPAPMFDRDAAPGPLRLRVPPGVSRLGFEFASPVFLGASSLRYRYRLVGWDAGWTETTAEQRLATYTRLSPGTYTLEVDVANSAGTWSGRPMRIALAVLPAWYQHGLFRAFALVSGLLLVVGAVQWRARQLRARALALEAMVEARTADLAAANAELAEAHRAVEEASLTDPLTGLHNRRFLWRHIDRDVAMALRGRFGDAADQSPSDLLFFLVDIDHFKRINDQHGHAVGDLVLVEMGRRLRLVFRESDHVVRWGGEEFLGVARGVHRADGAIVAERIRRAVADVPFPLPGGQTLAVRCSIGFSALPLVAAHRHAFGWEDTVAIADEALYAAKAAGRDGWAGFEETGEPIDPRDLAALRAHTRQAADVKGLVLRQSTPMP